MWKFRSMESGDRPASLIHPSCSSLWSQSMGTLIRLDMHHAPMDGKEGHWCGAGDPVVHRSPSPKPVGSSCDLRLQC